MAWRLSSRYQDASSKYELGRRTYSLRISLHPLQRLGCTLGWMDTFKFTPSGPLPDAYSIEPAFPLPFTASEYFTRSTDRLSGRCSASLHLFRPVSGCLARWRPSYKDDDRYYLTCNRDNLNDLRLQGQQMPRTRTVIQTMERVTETILEPRGGKERLGFAHATRGGKFTFGFWWWGA